MDYNTVIHNSMLKMLRKVHAHLASPLYSIKLLQTLTSSTDPDEMSHNVASSQGPHCLLR